MGSCYPCCACLPFTSDYSGEWDANSLFKELILLPCKLTRHPHAERSVFHGCVALLASVGTQGTCAYFFPESRPGESRE